MKTIAATLACCAALALPDARGQSTRPGSYPPLPDALNALAGDGEVRVSSIGTLIYDFAPVDRNPTTGLILYQGGFVDFRAYAPLARDIAKRGHQVVLVRSPLDFALLGAKWADTIMGWYPAVKKWAVGGHSLGGVAACAAAKPSGAKARGVLLLASYPSRGDSLRFKNVSVLSIYGTADGLTDATDIAASAKLLPKGTVFLAIQGGNHTQFGAYWDGTNPDFLQPGDLPAGISRADQQSRVAEAAAAWLRDL